MWIKISKENPITVGDTVEVLAVNTTTGKAIWLTEQQGSFILQLETVLAVDATGTKISRHLAMLGVFSSREEAKQKVDEFLTEVADREGLFEM